MCRLWVKPSMQECLAQALAQLVKDVKTAAAPAYTSGSSIIM